MLQTNPFSNKFFFQTNLFQISIKLFKQITPSLQDPASPASNPGGMIDDDLMADKDKDAVNMVEDDKDIPKTDGNDKDKDVEDDKDIPKTDGNDKDKDKVNMVEDDKEIPKTGGIDKDKDTIEIVEDANHDKDIPKTDGIKDKDTVEIVDDDNHDKDTPKTNGSKDTDMKNMEGSKDNNVIWKKQLIKFCLFFPCCVLCFHCYSFLVFPCVSYSFSVSSNPSTLKFIQKLL